MWVCVDDGRVLFFLNFCCDVVCLSKISSYFYSMYVGAYHQTSTCAHAYIIVMHIVRYSV